MKKIKLSEELRVFLVLCALIGLGIGMKYNYLRFLQNSEEKAAKKKKYNSLEILKYSADTLEWVFHNKKVKREFNDEWRHYRSKYNLMQSDDIDIIKYRGDTIEIRFRNSDIQRKFERQWRKYSDYKLNNLNQNIKKR